MHPTRLVASYLDTRLQSVCCNGVFSDLEVINFGVPQGSNIGPLLFIIYINDLPNVSTTLFFILFANQMLLVINGVHITQVITTKFLG